MTVGELREKLTIKYQTARSVIMNPESTDEDKIRARGKTLAYQVAMTGLDGIDIEEAVFEVQDESTFVTIKPDRISFNLEHCCDRLLDELTHSESLLSIIPLGKTPPAVVFYADVSASVKYCPFCGTKINIKQDE